MLKTPPLVESTDGNTTVGVFEAPTREELNAGAEAAALAIAISQSRAAQLATALSKAQGEFTSVPKDKTASVSKDGKFLYSFKYADWSAMLEMVRPVLKNNDLFITQRPLLREGKLRLVTRLTHISGGFLEDDGFVLPEGLEPQKLAGYTTYYKRIAGSAMLGISAEEDTDAPPEETKKKAGELPTGLGKKVKAGSQEAENVVPSESGNEVVQKIDNYKRSKEENEKLRGYIKKLGKEPVKSFILKVSKAPNTDSLTKEQWSEVFGKLDAAANDEELQKLVTD